MLKTVIVILLILLILSLFSGLWALLQDNGAPEKNRLLHRLIIRAGLAIGLVLLMSYGFYSGKITSQAPWSKNLSPAPATEATR